MLVMMLGMFTAMIGVVFFANGLVNRLMRGKSKQATRTMIGGVLPIVAGFTVIQFKDSLIDKFSFLNERANKVKEESESTPAPAPSPEPTPESHSEPLIDIDSTAAIIIAATLVILVLCILLYKKRAKRKTEQQEQNAHRNSVIRDFNQARDRINAISAAYAQAHVDPEYVLYKPLVISDNDLALRFSSALMEARNVLSQRQKLINSGSMTDIAQVNADELRALAKSLNDQWDKLNRDAEKVGTPLLNNGQLRRAESLWTMATNESATVHERQRAMSKLQEIITQCQNELNVHSHPKFTITKKAKRKEAEKQERAKSDNELLSAMSTIVDGGYKRGIITTPHRFDELIANADLPVLTAS